MRDIIEGIIKGSNVSVDYWYKVVFNRKIPRGICWLFILICIPISAVTTLVWFLFDRDKINETYEEMISDLKEKEA